MNPAVFTESVVEQASLAWLESLGYIELSSRVIAPGELQTELLSGEIRAKNVERLTEVTTT